MELIKISYEKQSYGFGKPEKVELKGVKFDSGKVAYLDGDTVQVRVNTAAIKQEIPEAIIEVIED